MAMSPDSRRRLRLRKVTNMKFSISLPTGFEGVMYPIPFVEPRDFVRLAGLANGSAITRCGATTTSPRRTMCAGSFPAAA